jgi:hypothetical protein
MSLLLGGIVSFSWNRFREHRLLELLVPVGELYEGVLGLLPVKDLTK